MEVWNCLHGYFLGRAQDLWTALFLVSIIYFGYKGKPLLLWTLTFAIALIGFGFSIPVLVIFTLLACLFNIKPLRRLISTPIMGLMRAAGFLPKISETERVALEAGVVWIERDFFSGNPSFKTLMRKTHPSLSEEEKAFLNGPVETLCAMVDDWKIWKERSIPTEVWNFLKKEKFFGIIIPKNYGGLEFSAHAHSEIIAKLTSRSISVAVTTMVPNSLGPAELLIHYGTQAQKDYYLPRLARGDEMPCFALTEPGAGSDAGSIVAEGILFKGEDGKLYLRLNWNKRWITLAGVATVIGLAFQLRDPENYLGRGTDVGITCALIPAKTTGVKADRRHDPMGIPFYNCPTQGRDVVVEAEACIIGGLANAGLGWKMLMESLAAGRGISLPSQSVAAAKLTSRFAGAHSTIRKQFGISIGKFEGVSEALARIAGLTYAMDAMRTLTTSALNQGIKPPIVTAITKYYATELGRKVINDGMDILAGAGLSRGPRNLLSSHYLAAPLGVTVEGANILTRTLMIFGQGVIRAHPYAYKLVKTLETNDRVGFDQALWGHVGHIVQSTFRAPLMSLSRGLVYWDCPKRNSRYFQKLAWASASFALTTNAAMVLLGSRLKFKESLSGRFSDVLAWIYIGFGVLSRFASNSYPQEDQQLVDWAMKYVFNQIQAAFDGIYANLKFPGLTWFIKGFGVWSRINTLHEEIPDELSHNVANLLMRTSESRNRLTQGIYISQNSTDLSGRLEHALRLSEVASKIEFKIKDAIKHDLLDKKTDKIAEKARMLGIISPDELQALHEAEKACWEAIQVDDFSEEAYKSPAVLG